jgi:hypothetical protein
MKHAIGIGLRAGAIVFAVVACLPIPANAYLVTIAAGARTIYLQVGTGTVQGGNFNAGGTPQDNGTINSVSVTVPAAALGTGARPMTSNSAVAISPFDGFAFCSTPNEVYVGGFYRRPNAGGNATLTVTTPATLVNAAADTIAFTSISWVSGGAGDPSATIPSGSFTGAAQTLLSIAPNRWFESCLAFSYANAQPVAAGTFTGRATYTLTAP